MRFHHSTRRGRSRLAHSSQSIGSGRHATGPQAGQLGARWARLGYCRETNIHFNRLLPVSPPEHLSQTCLTSEQEELGDELCSSAKPIDHCLNKLTLRGRVMDNKSQMETKSTSQSQDPESYRQRLMDQVEKHPFWSNKAARRMQLTGVEERRIYIYELISFCQRRDLEWCYEPYRGGFVAGSIPYRCLDPSIVPPSQPATPESRLASGSLYSGSSTGSTLLGRSQRSTPPVRTSSTGAIEPVGPELVWSIETPEKTQPAPFVAHSHCCEIPQSSFVKRCHGCSGRGRLKCNSCYGVGYEVCLSCSGKGTTKTIRSLSSSTANQSAERKYSPSVGGEPDQDQSGPSNRNQESSAGSALYSTSESCHYCHGAGQKRCWVCAGKAFNQCLACEGAGRLRCYLNLKITWLNHRDECILNNPDNIIPRERLRLCSGLQLVDQIGEPQLGPLERARLDGATGRAEEVNQLQAASKRLRDKHKHAYRDEKFLKQVSRHPLPAPGIPTT